MVFKSVERPPAEKGSQEAIIFVPKDEQGKFEESLSSLTDEWVLKRFGGVTELAGWFCGEAEVTRELTKYVAEVLIYDSEKPDNTIPHCVKGNVSVYESPDAEGEIEELLLAAETELLTENPSSEEFNRVDRIQDQILKLFFMRRDIAVKVAKGHLQAVEVAKKVEAPPNSIRAGLEKLVNNRLLDAKGVSVDELYGWLLYEIPEDTINVTNVLGFFDLFPNIPAQGALSELELYDPDHDPTLESFPSVKVWLKKMQKRGNIKAGRLLMLRKMLQPTTHKKQ